jgi:hypothetical protein
MVEFADHIERYLGSIQHGWSRWLQSDLMPFQVAECSGGVVNDAISFITLGLSNTELVSRVSSKLIRQELLMTFRSATRGIGVPSLLQQVGCEAMKHGTAFLRGDVIGPRDKLFANGCLEALYVTLPVYYPDAFSIFQKTNSTNIIIAWLVPISAMEADFVKRNGWSQFESVLEKKDPDLLDPYRNSVI